MKYVLFVCTQNAGRSQMAQALFEALPGRRPGGVRRVRAGRPRPPGRRRGDAEVGVDLSRQRPKRLTLEMQLHADWAVTLACGAKCPYVPSMVEDWDIEDPAGKPLDEVRVIRDQIEARVQELARDRINAIREDRRQHQMRMAQLVPGLVDEFGDRLSDEEIRAIADGILDEYEEVPVRSFVMTLANRRAREIMARSEAPVA